MSNAAAATPATVRPPAGADVTGRDRMAWNVAAGWAGQMVFFVAGFIVPRLIDNALGQAALGVWDFAWSLVAYLTLIQGGVVSAINRYVAKFRAAGDMAGVNQVINSVAVLLGVLGAVIAVLSWVLAASVPRLLAAKLAGYAPEAQVMVLLLGVSVSLQMASAVFGGVITGCHRWDLQNAILAGAHVLVVIGVIVALAAGGGLIALGAVVLSGEILRVIARIFVARWVLPEMRLDPRLARRRTAWNILHFGGKALLMTISELLSHQTISMLIVAFLGGSSLALYTRPQSLLRHGRTLMTKFAMVLIPTATSLQTLGSGEALAGFLIRATRFGAFVSFPLVALLAIAGGPVLRLWMGPDYAQAPLAAVLALAYLPLLLFIPANYVLVGLNLHGRPGIAKLVGGVIGAGLAALALGPLHAGLIGAAVGVGVGYAAVEGVWVPLYACRRLGLGLGRLLKASLVVPLLSVLPFAACLAAGVGLLPDAPLAALGLGGGIGAVVLAATYWLTAVPPRWKTRIKAKLPLRRRRGQGESDEEVFACSVSDD